MNTELNLTVNANHYLQYSLPAKLGLLLLSALSIIALGVLSLNPAQAAGAEFSTEFQAGQVNLGFAFKGKSILPAPPSVTLSSGPTELPDLWQAQATASTPGQGTPPNSLLSFKPAGCITPYTYRIVSPGPPPVVAPNDGQEGRPTTVNPDYPCDPNPATATIAGENNNGELTVPADQFRFPIMIVPNPLDNSPVPITLAAGGPLTGGYVDGQLGLAGPIEVRVLTGLATNPLGTYCSLDLPDRQTGAGLQLSTSYSMPPSVGFQGTPFSSISGPGALTGTWSITGDAESVGGADCETVNAVSKGLGGIWLGAGKDQPDPYPTCADGGTIGTFPNCQVPQAVIGPVTVSGPRVIRQRRPASWTVTVPSKGNVALRNVRVTLLGPGIRGSARTAEIAPGQSSKLGVRARAQRAGKVRLAFTIQADSASAKKVFKVVRVK